MTIGASDLEVGFRISSIQNYTIRTCSTCEQYVRAVSTAIYYAGVWRFGRISGAGTRDTAPTL